MSNSKPPPLLESARPNVCPVCGKSSYSAAGIHPQCAVKQGDEKLKARLGREKAKARSDKPKDAQASTRWQKTCPKCKLSQHVRKKLCECGHAFR
jgi:hypothetical protein